jgi:AraC-like DNA-binding protein
MLDMLSKYLAGLRVEVHEPRTRILTNETALLVPEGHPSIHLVRRGTCRARSVEARHPLPLGLGWALLLSGRSACSIQTPGPSCNVTAELDWNGGAPLEEIVFPPKDPSAALLLSARIKLRSRPGISPEFPGIATLDPERVWSGRWSEPVVETLNAELSNPRLGVSAIVAKLLEVVLIQGLRTELRDGSWRAPGWLGALTDPILRTGLIDAGNDSALASVRALATEVHRSPRRVRARVRGFTGAPPGHLLRQLRLEGAMRRLEEDQPTLGDLARELGYASVSTLCRAFRREVGCTPADYWRRTRGRPFPRPARHPPGRPTSDGEGLAPLDSPPAAG